MENGRIGGMGEKSGEMMGLAVEIGRIGRWSSGAYWLWSYQFETHVVHERDSPSSDSPDLHG